MSTVPSLRQIARNFRLDVDVPGWRGVGLKPEEPLVYRGMQKELFDALMRLARQAEEKRTQAVSALQSAEEVRKRGQRVRRILRLVQGLKSFPPRTPLKPRVRKGFERDGYCVEHVILESRPRFYVTGNLYLPTRFEPPWPAVLYVCGHSQTGKWNYQRIPAHLAMKGIAALVFDPVGQGERDEYVDIATGKRTVVRACRQHGVAGDPAYLLGSNFGAYRLWDAMRCVDYLQSREDIIGNRIGVSGTSGGGWESLWLAAIDPRIGVINSNCYITTFRRRMEDRHRDAEPDPEQDPFGLLAHGVDAADLLIACFPRPVSLGVTIRDFFPIDGALACYNEARALYAKAGVLDHIAITVADAGHENTLEMRRQTYRWMLRWLRGEAHGDDSERADFTNEDEATINCTKTGIVLTDLGGVTTGQLNAIRARELAIQRDKARTQRRWAESVPRRLAKLLRLEDDHGTNLLWQHEDAPDLTRLEWKLGNGVSLNGWMWRPKDKGARPAVIYITPKEENYDPQRNPAVRRLVREGNVVLDFDPRGMGPYRETWLEFVPLVEGNLTYDAFLLGRPILGMRVMDVLKAVALLRHDDQVDPDRITLHGVGYGALLALLAGCVEPRVAGVVEERGLTSYSSLCYHRCYDWPVNVILPGVLEEMDLEDVRSAIAPRQLTVIQPLDHMKRPLSAADARKAFATVRQAYRRAGAASALLVHVEGSTQKAR